MFFILWGINRLGNKHHVWKRKTLLEKRKLKQKISDDRGKLPEIIEHTGDGHSSVHFEKPGKQSTQKYTFLFNFSKAVIEIRFVPMKWDL